MTKGKKKDPGEFDFQKSLKEDAKYPVLKYFRVERFFTRPLAALLVRAVYRTSITPNHITFASFLLGSLSGIVFCFGTPRHFIIAGIMAQLTSVLDCADGQLARSKGLCTHYGAYLDLFLDRIADFILFSGIAVGYFNYSHNLVLFIMGLAGICLYFLQVTLYYVMQTHKNDTKPGQSAEARGLTIFVILVFSLLNRLDILVYLMAVETAINVVAKVLSFVRLNSHDVEG